MTPPPSVFVFQRAANHAGHLESGFYRLEADRDDEKLVLGCPECGGELIIGANYAIHENGFISPAVVCTRGGCAFHCMSRLDGWNNGPRAA